MHSECEASFAAFDVVETKETDFRIFKFQNVDLGKCT